MVSKILSTSALALLAARLAVAQTYSDCNPVEGDSEHPMLCFLCFALFLPLAFSGRC